MSLDVVDGSASAGNVADNDPDGSLDLATVDLDPTTAGVQSTLDVIGEGDWAVDAAGVVTFTPDAGFSDDPTPIPYTVSDNDGNVSNQATITIDYVPVATDDSSTGNTTNTAVTVDVTSNDTTGDTVDATTLQIVGTINPGDDLVVAGEGTWSVDGTSGEITFTPEAGFTDDPADITYTADDAEGNTSNAATVSIDYDRQPPVAVDDYEPRQHGRPGHAQHRRRLGLGREPRGHRPGWQSRSRLHRPRPRYAGCPGQPDGRR